MTNKKPIYILGLSAFYHDSAACLIKDGEIIAAAQEERFTRKKHDDAFPKKAIDYCLKEAGIVMDDLNYVSFYEKPFLKFERLLINYLSFAPFGILSFLKALPIWLKTKLFLKDYIQKELRFSGEIIFPEHHESHAASAFYPSPFKEAAILTMDGVGEWTTTSIGVGRANELELLCETKFPHSIGLLYSAFTYYCGFRVNSGEYKLMGLAPYGEPKYVDIIKKELIDIKADGSFKLNMSYFNYCVGLTMTNRKFDELFGEKPRGPETKLNQHHMDMARSIQEVTEEIMIKMANHACELTGLTNLCLAGGVALNCVGNGRILRESKMENVWIQPAAGDAGGALGAALMVWYRYLENDRDGDEVNDRQKGTYLGPCYSQTEVQKFVDEKKLPYEKLNDEQLSEKVAELLDSENVIGLFQGRMEFGPRALGARSIIGDARSTKMQEIMNLKIKFRESFRPFAPSVLKERAGDFFKLKGESPYMLLVADVNDEKLIETEDKQSAEGLDKLKIKRSVIPAITHVDNSARIQTVDEKTNPLYYKIIHAFYQKTQCPVIINTSFNIRGEPIVCTPEDAYRCFMVTNMDYLVVNNLLFEKQKQPNKDQFRKDDISTILD